MTLGLLGVLLLGSSALAETDAPNIGAKGAILIEAETGRVLFEQNADRVLEPASTTKIMTAIVAVESGDLGRMVTVSERAAGTEGSSLYLKAGEKLPLIDLLYGLMMQSGNDAAVAIAEAVGGSVEQFVQAMNEKAAELELLHTHFENPNGLHAEGHATTPRELCAIARYAMQNETFRALVSTVSYASDSGTVPHSFRSKNKFLTQYEGCNGVKTGYTKAAGKCLVFAAKRSGMQLLGVVMNDSDMWGDAKALLDWGFETFAMHTAVEAHAVFTVNLGETKKISLPAAAKHDILVPIRSDGTETVTVRQTLIDTIPLPVEAGDPVGQYEVLLDGKPFGSAVIAALESIHAPSFGAAMQSVLEGWQR